MLSISVVFDDKTVLSKLVVKLLEDEYPFTYSPLSKRVFVETLDPKKLSDRLRSYDLGSKFTMIDYGEHYDEYFNKKKPSKRNKRGEVHD